MKAKPLFTAILLAIATAAPASAQFLDDLQGLLGRIDTQPSRSQERAVKVDYNVDFHYFLDVREFGVSDDIFVESEIINLARFSPSVVVRFDQTREITHRLSLGIDLTKELGANPTRIKYYSESEHESSIRNTALMKDIFFYYNYIRRMQKGQLGFYAGIHPRTALQGYYTRAIFADELIYNDPNIEGITIQYSSPRFSMELAGDLIGQKGVDRIGGEMAFTSIEYRPFKWAAVGLDGSYEHVRGNYLYPANAEYAVANPYIKFDFAPLLNIQEFYIKGGGLGSYVIDHDITDEQPHIPLGAEAVIGVRHWGIGLEDTFYYGENQQVYYGSAYQRIANVGRYVETLYQGETFYFTRRSVPTWYNRAEVYWQPLNTDYVTARMSAVGHFITPAGEVGPYIGLQAKATLLFNLDAFRHPRESAPEGRRTRNQRTERRSPGTLFSL